MIVDVVKLRLFIEGVLVSKVNNVTVQTFDNETARASFTLPPIPGFETEELVRARVHIFWSDVETRAEHDDDDWPLLFEGEIVADGFGKTPQSRSQSFHCAGYSTYWEQVLLYYYDAGRNSAQQAPWVRDVSVALGNDQFNLDAQQAGGNVTNFLVNDFENTLTDVSSSEGYHSVVRILFGKALDTNYFFRESNRALALNSRFVSPRDENIRALINRRMLIEMLNNDVLAVDSEQSMMQTLHNVLRSFRYQILHNAQPVLLDPRERRRQSDSLQESVLDRHLGTWRTYLEGLQPFESLADVTSVGLTQAQIDGYVSQIQDAGTADNTNFFTLMAENILVDLGYQDSTGPDSAKLLQEIITTAGAVSVALEAAADPGDSDTLDRNQQLDRLLSQFLVLPDTRFALPPTCNVIFPSQQTNLSMSRDLLKRPTRGISSPFSEFGQSFRVFITPDEMPKARVPPRSVEATSTAGFHRPVLAPHRISSGFGPRQIRQVVDLGNGKKRILHPHGPRPHEGIDIARPGNQSKASFVGTPVYAFDEGVVERAGAQDPTNIKRGYGLRVYINHPNGIQTRYAHLNRHYVNKGDYVERGQPIGEIGSTGTSTGPHLHFEVRVNGTPVDPEPLIKAISDDNGTAGRQLPEASGTEDAAAAEVPEETAAEGAGSQADDEQFADYKYLTPEEEIKGIVPFFDRDTVRAHINVSVGGDAQASDDYLRQMLRTEFFHRRFQASNVDTLTMPWNPNVIAGFPALIVDPARSIIGRVTSVVHSVTVGGGQGSASTSVTIDAPRFWDEGDPYHWRGGKESYGPVQVGNDTLNLPDANFVGPKYYLTSLVGTNSTDDDDWWSARMTTPRLRYRPVDELYEQLLGAGVRGIPYHYASRETNQGVTVAYNKAIDSRRESPAGTQEPFPKKQPNANTIVGRYYTLVDQDPELATEFVRTFTRRRGISERVLMSRVLGATTADSGFSYTASAFRPVYQATVRRMIAIVNETKVFRG